MKSVLLIQADHSEKFKQITSRLHEFHLWSLDSLLSYDISVSNIEIGFNKNPLNKFDYVIIDKAIQIENSRSEQLAVLETLIHLTKSLVFNKSIYFNNIKRNSIYKSIKIIIYKYCNNSEMMFELIVFGGLIYYKSNVNNKDLIGEIELFLNGISLDYLYLKFYSTNQKLIYLIIETDFDSSQFQNNTILENVI